jgi:sulfofructose kinase
MSRLVCLGILVKDLVFRVPVIPPTPQKLTCTGLRTQFGGMAATAAAAAAALGGQVEFWGRVGDDETGVQAEQALRQRGVLPRLHAQAGSKSPLSAVIVDDAGERMLAVYTGDLDAAPDWLPLQALAGAGAVHADFRWVAGARAFFVAARALGLPRVLDADAGTVGALRELVPLADHVIFSERGLQEFAGDLPPEQALRQVARLPGEVVGVTLGERGALFCRDGQVRAFAAPRVQAVDTNGAGDVFHGAYALALARGLHWTQAVDYAAMAASLKCTRDHDWNTLPTHEEVTAALASRHHHG